MEKLVNAFQYIPARDIIFGLLIIGLMLLNWRKDKLITELINTVRGLSSDVKVLSELFRVLVYGKNIFKNEKIDN